MGENDLRVKLSIRDFSVFFVIDEDELAMAQDVDAAVETFRIALRKLLEEKNRCKYVSSPTPPRLQN